MLKVLRYICSIATFLFAAYGLITKNFEYNTIMILFMGLTFLIMGLEEFQKKRPANGWLFILVFLLTVFVSIKGFLLS